jgi:hypothetical protein
MKRTKLASIVALTVVLGIVSVASADIVYESKGWRFTMPSWSLPQSGAAIVEDQLGPNVQNPEDILLIELSKVFKGEPSALTGSMPSMQIGITQIADDADTASQIVINDEAILNLTSVAWIDFHMILVTDDQVGFNTALSEGINSEPFANMGWEGFNSVGATELNFWNGIVGVGDQFSPGSLSGEIVIDADLSGDEPVSFFLKEIPTIPEPATMAILGLGGLTALLRRKRK